MLFRNPAELIAKIYVEELEKCIEHFDVVFAIYNAGYDPQDNFGIFSKVFQTSNLIEYLDPSITDEGERLWSSPPGTFASGSEELEDMKLQIYLINTIGPETYRGLSETEQEIEKLKARDEIYANGGGIR